MLTSFGARPVYDLLVWSVKTYTELFDSPPPTNIVGGLVATTLASGA